MLGVGAAETIGAQAKALRSNKALLVTDNGIVKTGMADAAKKSLASEKIDFLVFDGVELETPARVIEEGARYARDNTCDLLIALGEGRRLIPRRGSPWWQ